MSARLEDCTWINGSIKQNVRNARMTVPSIFLKKINNTSKNIQINYTLEVNYLILKLKRFFS